VPPVTFLSAADVEVDAERRRFSSSIDGVRLAGAEPTEPDGRPREIALRRDRRACQTTPGVVVVVVVVGIEGLPDDGGSGGGSGGDGNRGTARRRRAWWW